MDELSITESTEYTVTDVKLYVTGHDYNNTIRVLVGGVETTVRSKRASYVNFRIPASLGAGTYDVELIDSWGSRKVGEFKFISP